MSEFVRLLTEKHVARLLSLSVKTLRNRRVLDPHFLPFCKIGRMVRYRESDVQALIERGMRSSTSDKGGTR